MMVSGQYPPSPDRCQDNVMIIVWWQFAPDPDRRQSDRSTPPPPHSLSSSLASATSSHIITNVMFSIMRWKISLKAWKRILSRISLCHLSFKGENLMKLWFKGESIFVNVSWAKACLGKRKSGKNSSSSPPASPQNPCLRVEPVGGLLLLHWLGLLDLRLK